MTITRAQSTRSEPPLRPAGERPASARIVLRRGQRINFDPATAGREDYVVESGCLTLDADVARARRQVIMVLLGGDGIARDAVPMVEGIGLTATTASVVVRHADKASSGTTAVESDDRLTAQRNRLLARLALHTLAIGRLSGEERLATLLLDLARRVGRPTPGGIVFDLPLTRADMADHLALNPDTLSRLMSRLKSRRLVTTPARNRAIVHDLAGLEALTPLAAAIERMSASVGEPRPGTRRAETPPVKSG